jgi:hypothetical protein
VFFSLHYFWGELLARAGRLRPGIGRISATSQFYTFQEKVFGLHGKEILVLQSFLAWLTPKSFSQKL